VLSGRLLVPILLVLLTASSVFAANPSLVDKAIGAMKEERRDGWAFRMTTVEDGERKVESYDPSKPEGLRWTLEEDEGAVPTDEEMAKYREKKAKKLEKTKRLNVDQLVREGSTRLVSETATHAVYSFKVNSEDDREEKVLHHLDGLMTINKDGPWVEKVELGAPGAFSPIPMVSIREISTVMTFDHLPESTVPGPMTFRSHIRGTAFFFKRIVSDVDVTFSDWRYVGAAPVATSRR